MLSPLLQTLLSCSRMQISCLNDVVTRHLCDVDSKVIEMKQLYTVNIITLCSWLYEVFVMFCYMLAIVFMIFILYIYSIYAERWRQQGSHLCSCCCKDLPDHSHWAPLFDTERSIGGWQWVKIECLLAWWLRYFVIR